MRRGRRRRRQVICRAAVRLHRNHLHARGSRAKQGGVCQSTGAPCVDRYIRCMLCSMDGRKRVGHKSRKMTWPSPASDEAQAYTQSSHAPLFACLHEASYPVAPYYEHQCSSFSYEEYAKHPNATAACTDAIPCMEARPLGMPTDTSSISQVMALRTGKLFWSILGPLGRAGEPGYRTILVPYSRPWW